MGCLASKASVEPRYKNTRESLGLEKEQWCEINARKQLLPGLLERVRPAFQSMFDEGKTMKEMFLAFDEDDGGGVDADEFREGFEGLGVTFTDQEFGWIIGIWMGDEDELELPEFTAIVKKTLEGHQFPLPPLPWSP